MNRRGPDLDDLDDLAFHGGGANEAESFHPSLEKPTIGGALENPSKKL
jgi:hypothetical protein